MPEMEFNPYSDNFFDNPYETYRWMRDEAPVYYSDRWSFYALTRNKDVVAAHRDWNTFSSAYGVTLVRGPFVKLPPSVSTLGHWVTMQLDALQHVLHCALG